MSRPSRQRKQDEAELREAMEFVLDWVKANNLPEHPGESPAERACSKRANDAREKFKQQRNAAAQAAAATALNVSAGLTLPTSSPSFLSPSSSQYPHTVSPTLPNSSTHHHQQQQHYFAQSNQQQQQQQQRHQHLFPDSLRFSESPTATHIAISNSPHHLDPDEQNISLALQTSHNSDIQQAAKTSAAMAATTSTSSPIIATTSTSYDRGNESRKGLSAAQKYNIRLRNNRKSAHAAKVFQEIYRREISRCLLEYGDPSNGIPGLVRAKGAGPPANNVPIAKQSNREAELETENKDLQNKVEELTRLLAIYKLRCQQLEGTRGQRTPNRDAHQEDVQMVVDPGAIGVPSTMPRPMPPTAQEHPEQIDDKETSGDAFHEMSGNAMQHHSQAMHGTNQTSMQYFRSLPLSSHFIHQAHNSPFFAPPLQNSDEDATGKHALMQNPPCSVGPTSSYLSAQQNHGDHNLHFRGVLGSAEDLPFDANDVFPTSQDNTNNSKHDLNN